MRVLKSYGAEGGVLVSTSGLPEDKNFKGPVFIEFDGLPVPFFIESISPKGNTKAFVKFEDVDTLEEAEELVGREVSLGDSEEEEEWLIVGFTLFDQNKKEIGTIAEFVDIPGNPCVEVERGEERVLVPCHEDLIIKIDERRERLYLTIPDGLL